MRPLLVFLLAGSFSCAGQSNSAALGNALLTTALVVATHPQMVIPRSESEQEQMELDAERDQTPLLVPSSILGPDLFLIEARELAPPGIVVGD